MPATRRKWRRGLLMSGLLLGGIYLPSHVSAERLPTIIEMAIDQHPDMVIANANIAVVESAVASAQWQYYPTASMSVESAYAAKGDADYAGDNLVATLHVQQPLWNWGDLQAGVDIAESKLLIEQARKRQQQWQLAQSVIDAYGTWLSAYWKVRAWDQGLNDHQTLLKQVQKRVNQGVSAQIDLALAQGRVASTKAEYLASNSDLQIAVQELQQLTNSDLTSGNLVSDIASPLPIDFTVDAASNTQNNPALTIAEAAIDVAKYELAQHQAKAKPAIYLRAEHQINSFSNADFTPRTRAFIGMSGSTGAGLSLISDQQGFEQTVRAKESELVAEKRQIQQTIETARLRAESLQQRLASLQTAMVTTTSVSESYRRQFLAGRKSWLDVINAARESVQMQVQIADLKSAYVVASWRLGLLVNGLDWIVAAEVEQ